MAVNPTFETAFCIHLVIAKHLFIRNKALQYCCDPHIINTHEHSSNKPSDCRNEKKWPDNAVQFLTYLFIHGNVSNASCERSDEHFPHEHNPTRHVSYGTNASSISTMGRKRDKNREWLCRIKNENAMTLGITSESKRMLLWHWYKNLIRKLPSVCKHSY